MIDILLSREQAYELGTTLMILSNVWMWIALLSYMAKRNVRFFLECMLTIVFYLPALACLLSGISKNPAGSILKILFHTTLIAIPIIIIIHKHAETEKTIKPDVWFDETIEFDENNNETS